MLILPESYDDLASHEQNNKIGVIYLSSGEVRSKQNITGFVYHSNSDFELKLWSPSREPLRVIRVEAEKKHTVFSFFMEDSYTAGTYSLELIDHGDVHHAVNFELSEFVKENILLSNLPHARYTESIENTSIAVGVEYAFDKPLTQLSVNFKVCV